MGSGLPEKGGQPKSAWPVECIYILPIRQQSSSNPRSNSSATRVVMAGRELRCGRIKEPLLSRPVLRLPYRADFVDSLASCARLNMSNFLRQSSLGRRLGKGEARGNVAREKIEHRSQSSLRFHRTGQKNPTEDALESFPWACGNSASLRAFEPRSTLGNCQWLPMLSMGFESCLLVFAVVRWMSRIAVA